MGIGSLGAALAFVVLNMGNVIIADADISISNKIDFILEGDLILFVFGLFFDNIYDSIEA